MPSAVKPDALSGLTGADVKAAAEADGRRKEVAAAPPVGSGPLSPLSTTAGQLTLVVLVVGLVGAAMVTWAVRAERRSTRRY